MASMDRYVARLAGGHRPVESARSLSKLTYPTEARSVVVLFSETATAKVAMLSAAASR